MSPARPRLQTPDHGHYLNYLRDGHRDPECTEAWRIHCQEQRAKRKKIGLRRGDPRHGTDNGYKNWGCKCRKCTAAHNKKAGKPNGA